MIFNVGRKTSGGGIPDNIIIDSDNAIINGAYFKNLQGNRSTTNIDTRYDRIEFYMSNSSQVKVYTDKTIDLTNYNTMTVTGHGYLGYAAKVYVSQNGTSYSSSVSIQGSDVKTVTLDVSGLTGEYHIGVDAYIAGVSKITFE